jgi:branched-chain amino acid transport system ATP-binding protein
MRLEIKDLRVHYGKIEAIKGVSVVVNQGEIVTLSVLTAQVRQQF